MSLIDDYRKQIFTTIKTVVTPSGATFKIQPVKAAVIILSDGLTVKDSNNLTDDERKKLMKFNIACLCNSVVDPKITEEGGEDSLSVNELLNEDFNFLLKEILKLSNLGGMESPSRFSKKQKSTD